MGALSSIHAPFTHLALRALQTVAAAGVLDSAGLDQSPVHLFWHRPRTAGTIQQTRRGLMGKPIASLVRFMEQTAQNVPKTSIGIVVVIVMGFVGQV